MDCDRSDRAGPAHCTLISVPTVIEFDRLLTDPRWAAFAAEDACWKLALDDWRSRTPHRWQRRRLRRWVAEGVLLFADQERLQALAYRYGLAG